MESPTLYWMKLLTYSLFLLFLKFFCIFPLMVGAEEPDPNVLKALEQQYRERIRYEQSLPKAVEPDPEVLKAIEQQHRERIRYEQSLPKVVEPDPEVLKAIEQQDKKRSELKQPIGTFEKKDLMLNLLLDLPPDTVLATLKGEPLVNVDEFNKKVKPAETVRGKDLFEARYKILRKIIDTKLVSAVARKAGFENDPLVKERLKKAKSEVEAEQKVDQYVGEINDHDAQQYYKKNIEKFRQPDRGTRVLFVVKGTLNEALEILKQLKKGEPIEKFSFSPKPILGSLMPARVQEAIFHLEPGQLTEVIRTPIGFYIVKLVERNPFDQFKVSVIVKNTLQECQKTLKRIEAGVKFEDLVAEKGHLSIALTELPVEVQRTVPGMELHEVSQPISTWMGYLLVKLQERRCNAQIEAAKVIGVNSKVEGEKILASIKKGLPIGHLQERKIAGKDLTSELNDVAKALKEGEYSSPTKTRLGYYLVKVEKRVRQKFKPFDLVKEDIKKMIKAETISDEEARKYYESHRTQYRKPGLGYIVDIILTESLNQGEKISTELKNAPEGEKKEALFVKYQKDLKEVPVEVFPVDCKNIVQDLKPGQLSPVITTPLGYFILRLRKIESPVYLAFEDVQYEIKSSLALQKTEQTGQRDKGRSKIILTQVEEEALVLAYYRSYMKGFNNVTDEEAEEWWRNNKENLIAAFKTQEEDIKFASPEKAMQFKKKNVLLGRHMAMIKGLYIENNVVIYENLLNQM